MTRRTHGRATAMKTRILRAAVLAGALGLAACSGGGGGPSMPATGTDTEIDTRPPPAVEPMGAMLTGLHFDYTLRRAGERPIEEDGSVLLACLVSGCAVVDLRELSGSGTRDGFATVTGPVGVSGHTASFTGVSVTASDVSVLRYGFWAEYGHAAVEIGTGALSAVDGGRTWRGDFTMAHAVVGGEVSGTNPAGTGGATWRGIAEAVRIAGFERLPGTAELNIANLSQPRVDVAIDLDDGGSGVALRWTGMTPAAGSFSGRAGSGRIDGRFHGPGHEEAWGVFDTDAYVGAFGAKRE